MSPQAEVVTGGCGRPGFSGGRFRSGAEPSWPPRSRWRRSCCLCWWTPCSSCPSAALVSLFAVWAVLSLAAVAALLVRQQRGRRSLAATARRVELAFPELEAI